MSTRARPSTAGSSCTNTLRRASVSAATMNAMLVSSTSPSGTIATTPATVNRKAVSNSWSRDWLQRRRADTGINTHVTMRRMVLMPSISSDRVNVKRRASAASFRAYESAPTRVAWNRPEPATTKLPESTSSSGSLSSGSLSPVSSDSSTSSPSALCTTPSHGIWSPGRSSSRSSITTCSTAISATWPSRTTRARGALSTASRSRVRLARTSWKMPIPALATSISPKVASWIGPMIAITSRAAPRMALKRVNTLARTISPSVRLVRSPVSLVAPRATRSWTSAAVSPVTPVTV